jgi:cation channel sperm-associated protein 1
MGMYSSKLSSVDSQGGLIASASASGGMSQGGNAADDVLPSDAEVAQWPALRRMVYGVVQSKSFGSFILLMIFANTLLIALQTDRGITQSAAWYFDVADNMMLGVYVFECAAKMYSLRRRFRKSGWNLFDLFIVITSFIEYIQVAIASSSFINPRIFRILRIFRAVRALRALRVLRSIRFLQKLQVIVNTLLSSVPAMANVIILLLLVMFIYSLVGRNLYADAYPERFGNTFRAFFEMFQLITLDDWTREYTRLSTYDPYSFFYFATFIVLVSFILVNLFIAVLVSALEASQARLKAELKKDKKEDKKELRKLQDEQGVISAKKDTAATGSSLQLNQKNQTDHPHNQHLHVDRDGGLSQRQKALTNYYFQLLASTENNFNTFLTQQRFLDELVDITQKVHVEEEEKGE